MAKDFKEITMPFTSIIFLLRALKLISPGSLPILALPIQPLFATIFIFVSAVPAAVINTGASYLQYYYVFRFWDCQLQMFTEKKGLINFCY